MQEIYMGERLFYYVVCVNAYLQVSSMISLIGQEFHNITVLYRPCFVNGYS